MKNLFNYQINHFSRLIYKRFIFWVLLIDITALAIVINNKHNSGVPILTKFFAGTSFQSLAQGMQLPVLWIAYFMTPLLIILNGYISLDRSKIMQLHGLGFTNLQIGIINLIIMFLMIFLFTIMTVIPFFIFDNLIEKNSFELIQMGHIFSNTFISLLLITLIYMLISLLDMCLGMFVVISYMIFTCFNGLKINVLNIAMLSRLDFVNEPQLLIGSLLINICLIVSYCLVIRKMELSKEN